MRRVLSRTAGDFSGFARVLGTDSSTLQWGRLFAAAVVAGWALAPAIGFLGSLRLLTLLGLGAAFLGFRRPAIGLPGIMLVCTLDPLTRHFLLTGEGLLRWNTFNYWLLLVMALSVTFLRRVADPHSKILKAFLALLLIELVFTPALEMGVQHVLGALTTFGLLAYFAQAADEQDCWYTAAVANGLAGALGGLVFYAAKDEGLYINANAWAFFPETAIFCICLALRHAHSRPHGQLILGLLATVNYVWVFLSGSRGGLFIASVGLLFVVLSLRRTTERLAYVAFAGLIAVAASSIFTAEQDQTIRRLTKLLDEEQSAAARTNGRSELAKAGLHMFQEQPLGVGTGGFARAWSQLGFVPGVSGFMRGQEFQAHSGWIKVLVENGWPGLLLLAAYVFSFAFYGIWIRQPGSTALGILVTATLMVTFLSTEFQGKGYWMLAAAATAQLHSLEMARSLAAEARKFGVRPQRVLEVTRA